MKILNVFNTFNFETDFLENETVFQKTGVTFLVESTKIENASFPYKSAIPELNVKTNRMITIQTKSGVLSETALFF